MCNMTTYKCKFTISRLEHKTYLSRTENHIFALKSSTNTNKSLDRHKNRVSREINNILAIILEFTQCSIVVFSYTCGKTNTLQELYWNSARTILTLKWISWKARSGHRYLIVHRSDFTVRRGLFRESLYNHHVFISWHNY